MTFFEQPAPGTTPETEPENPPAWFERPQNEMGAVVATKAILYRDQGTAVTLTGLVAFSTGLDMQLNIFRRVDDLLRLFDSPVGAQTRDEPATPKMLRFGIEYADGRRASNLDRFDETWEAGEIHLFGGAGGGGGFSFRSSYWASPLPPPGKVAFVIEWPIVGLPETRTAIDAAPILEAAARSERLWEYG
jgi:hypothetical protein